MMECTLGFSYNENALSRAIKQKMGVEYSHVFLLFKWRGEFVVFHATRRGVNAMSFDVFKQHNKIVSMVPIADRSKVRSAFKYCVSMLGTPYGYLAIIAIGLGIHYEDGEKTLICSEYVARALGFDPKRLPDTVTPKDLEGYLA